MGKKRKITDASSSGSVRTLTVQYADIPPDQKITWVLNEEVDVLYRYKQLLEWIRYWSSKDGTSFEGIHNLCCVGGYPLIEVEVVYREKSAKFLISRASLYILAFFCPSLGWRVFEDLELKIVGEGFKVLKMTAAYTGEPWKMMGPREIIGGLDNIENPDEELAADGCQVFMVHLCEASRITLVQLVIERALIPSTSAMWRPLHEDELQLVSSSRRVTDIIESLKPTVVDLTVSVSAPDEVQSFIKKYRELSQAWYIYALTKKKFCPLKKEIARDCGILNRRSLRYSLALLCNTSLEKLHLTWEGRFEKNTCPPDFPATKEILEDMKKKIVNLEKQSLEKARAYTEQLEQLPLDQ